MLRLFQKITKNFSIKSIVILGVVIMSVIIIAFALTMTYLSSTIKYDQATLKHILELEKYNQNILSTIKDIDYIDNKILILKNAEDLEVIEEELLETKDFKYLLNMKKNNKYELSYNEKIDEIAVLLNSRIILQKEVYDSKLILLYFKNELQNYKNKMDDSIFIIEDETDKIYGIASLITKRYNRKIKKGLGSNNPNKIKELGRIMTTSKDLDRSILKLPTFIHHISSTSNLDVIYGIDRNNLSQLILLVEDSLLSMSDLVHLDKDFPDSLSIMRSRFMKIRELVTFFITSKKQFLKEEKRLEKLIYKSDNINNEIFNKVEVLNEISNKIKLEILNHSDSISKKTTYTIVIVGFISLLLLSLSAATLISRINMPLEFIIKYIDSIIDKKRKLSSKLPIISSDEFAKLSKSFNNMTSTISSNIHEIKHLNQEIEDTQKEVIFTMGAIGETRSKETGNHVKRVAEYSRILALKYGLEPKVAELLKEASPMHDIGKVGIPDSVLKKPAALDDDEWKVMKTHAELGYDMLKHSHRDILKAAAIVAFEHHEKWDGSGYPRGLKGKDIHIFGRITAVADVFDALGSDRCYKKAWSLDKIKEFFNENKSTHFDPELVDLFLENIDEFLYVRDEYKDIFE